MQTYTTQSAIKKGNKDMEVLLRDLEYLATLASLVDSGYRYPKWVLRLIFVGGRC
jgi:alpha-mannosidase